MDEVISKAIKGEVNYIMNTDIGRSDLADTIVALRVGTHTTMQCFVTSSGIKQKHTMHYVRHVAGLVQYYFLMNKFSQEAQPRVPLPSMGCWLVNLDLAVRRAEDAISRSAIGDAKGYLMDILSILVGMMSQFGVEERQGYEI